MVGTAIGVGVRAATKLAVAKVAASLSGRASSSGAAGLREFNGGKLDKDEAVGALNALSLGDITGVSVGAAVGVIGTAIGVGVRAATELAVAKVAASLAGRASSSGARGLRLNDGGDGGENKGGGSLDALSLGDIASVSVGAAVGMIGTAIGVGVRAATELAVAKVAASLAGRASSSGAAGLRFRNLGQLNYEEVLGTVYTLSLGDIASVSVGAAMRVVGTAVGTSVRAASELSVAKAATSFRGGASASWTIVSVDGDEQEAEQINQAHIETSDDFIAEYTS
jgi:hypothetical protein